MTHHRFFTALGSGVLVWLAACGAPPEPADLVLLNGKIVTLEDEQPVVETQTESLALEAMPWNRSMDQSSTFYPGHLLRPFLESMYGMTTLAVSTTPTGKAPLTAIFDIEGIEDALVNVRTACEWE